MIGVHTFRSNMEDRQLEVNRGEDAIGIVVVQIAKIFLISLHRSTYRNSHSMCTHVL